MQGSHWQGNLSHRLNATVGDSGARAAATTDSTVTGAVKETREPDLNDRGMITETFAGWTQASWTISSQNHPYYRVPTTYGYVSSARGGLGNEKAAQDRHICFGPDSGGCFGRGTLSRCIVSDNLANCGGGILNDGGTLTRTLLPGSPAIDAIPASDCPLDTDQRGELRPVVQTSAATPCDICAFELQTE